MASTTKVMTALLAIETGGLDRLIAVADAAVGTEGSSMYLKRGEKLTLSDLLYGLMLTSGNDAAVAIACAIDGSVDAFAERMNARARELGCADTNFVNPNGLQHPEHYTTARDLCRIACAAMQNETFRTIVSTTYHVTQSGDAPRTIKNKNRLLWEYEGGNGVKTGYTTTAGKCLAFSARRGELQLVGVVLDCPSMWQTAKQLLDLGFETLEMQRLLPTQLPFLSIEVKNGDKERLAVVPKQGILYPIRKDGSDDVRVSVTVAEEPLSAPVAHGTEVGRVTIRVNGEVVLSGPLVTAEGAERLTYPYYLREVLRRMLY